MSDENSRNRAELWGDYVGWDGRKQGEGGFLVRQLGERAAQRVLDVALGDGVDTISLIRAGFDVECNEADRYFRERAIANAAQYNIALNPTGYAWPELTSGYQENAFDAVICFGHSIGCVLDEAARRQSLGQFYRVLRPGGALMIDERNFRKMENSIKLGEPFVPSGKYVYTGSGKIALQFVEKTDDRILGIEYSHTETGQKAYYRVYSFREGELKDTLEEAGFAAGAIQTYSDYQSTLAPDPHADYYQYIGVK